ncbi:MAG TPA: class I SAM-dependent methyltransferase [Candidatus Acidoferrales bacterium]|nr:class I SAM-dependent methyltransferase [Candidatus Acidoferrales bacterium]
MKRKKEKNIDVFNDDIQATGKYRYTNFEKSSAYSATKRQSDELIKILQSKVGRKTTVLDVGCGDGTFTLELLLRAHPEKIVGFDYAKNAIQAARRLVLKKDKRNIIFKTINVYDANKVFDTNSFDVIVIRGVLHHLYDPERAVNVLSPLSKRIIVLEPNGYNPIIKLIEKLSPYHKQHEEKSFWPPKLNSWFINAGFIVKDQQFFGIVPYFCPDFAVSILQVIQPVMERLPFVNRLYCGTNLIYYERRTV